MAQCRASNAAGASLATLPRSPGDYLRLLFYRKKSWFFFMLVPSLMLAQPKKSILVSPNIIQHQRFCDVLYDDTIKFCLLCQRFKNTKKMWGAKPTSRDTWNRHDFNRSNSIFIYFEMISDGRWGRKWMVYNWCWNFDPERKKKCIVSPPKPGI